jgi:hypothetical protein
MSNRTSSIFHFDCKVGIIVATSWRLVIVNTTPTRVYCFSVFQIVPIYGYLTRELTSFGKTNLKTKSVNLRLQFKHHSRSFQRLPTKADVIIKFPRPADWVIHTLVSLPRPVGRHFHIDLQAQQQILIAYSTCTSWRIWKLLLSLSSHKYFIGKNELSGRLLKCVPEGIQQIMHNDKIQTTWVENNNELNASALLVSSNTFDHSVPSDADLGPREKTAYLLWS